MSALNPINPGAAMVLAPMGGATRASSGGVTLRLIAVCLSLMTVLAVGFTAYAAQEFLIPVAIALLLAIVASPVARFLEARGAAPTLAAAMITFALLAMLALVLWLVLPQMAQFGEQLPGKVNEIERRIGGIASTFDGLQRASAEIQEATQQAGVTPENEPVTVQQATPLTIALTSLSQIVAQSAAAILLMFFLLAQRRRMKTIVVAMARTHTTRKRLITMFNDIKTRIATYLLTIVLTSIVLGAVSAAALYAIGFPNPVLWGVGVAVLNLVPYAGPLIVQLAALVVGALSFPTFWEAVAPAFILWTLNTVEGQFITPMFVAKRVVLNPLSVVLAIVFGAWIWGAVGAVVAVPALIVAASVIQHWWAPCATDSRRPPAAMAWRGWHFESTLPAFRARRAGLQVLADELTAV
jgi:predicted PurR-regulated permease PerM